MHSKFTMSLSATGLNVNAAIFVPRIPTVAASVPRSGGKCHVHEFCLLKKSTGGTLSILKIFQQPMSELEKIGSANERPVSDHDRPISAGVVEGIRFFPTDFLRFRCYIMFSHVSRSCQVYNFIFYFIVHPYEIWIIHYFE